MSVILEQPKSTLTASKALDVAARSWFITMIIGQALFVIHIVGFYYVSAFRGDFAKWSEVLDHGITSGDYIGNLAIGGHIFLAALITLGGPMQLLPATQKRWPAFHRWNGRLYMITALLISLAGLYIIIVKGPVGGWYIALGNFINAFAIITTGILAWYFAIKGKLGNHRAWALRLFMVASGVWFFRILFGFWILVNGAAPGHTEAFDGPFDMFLVYGHTLLPLFFTELYLLAGRSRNVQFKFTMSVVLGLLTIALGMGIFMAAMIFWI